MSLHTPKQLFSNINNGGLFRRERDSEWQDSHPFTLYLLDRVVKKKKTNTPFHCHNAGLEAYNNL